MSGVGVENRWRLRGGGEWIFNYPFFFFFVLFVFFFVLVCWLRSATNLWFLINLFASAHSRFYLMIET